MIACEILPKTMAHAVEHMQRRARVGAIVDRLIGYISADEKSADDNKCSHADSANLTERECQSAPWRWLPRSRPRRYCAASDPIQSCAVLSKPKVPTCSTRPPTHVTFTHQPDPSGSGCGVKPTTSDSPRHSAASLRRSVTSLACAHESSSHHCAREQFVFNHFLDKRAPLCLITDSDTP